MLSQNLIDTEEANIIRATGKGVTEIDILPVAIATKCRLLYVSYNSIQSLENITQFKNITDLMIEFNLISKIDDLLPLAQLPNLKVLRLDGNPICSLPLFILHILNLCPNLKMLNGRKVSLIKSRMVQNDFKFLEEEKNLLQLQLLAEFVSNALSFLHDHPTLSMRESCELIIVPSEEEFAQKIRSKGRGMAPENYIEFLKNLILNTHSTITQLALHEEKVTKIVSTNHKRRLNRIVKHGGDFNIEISKLNADALAMVGVGDGASVISSASSVRNTKTLLLSPRKSILSSARSTASLKTRRRVPAIIGYTDEDLNRSRQLEASSQRDLDIMEFDSVHVFNPKKQTRDEYTQSLREIAEATVQAEMDDADAFADAQAARKLAASLEIEALKNDSFDEVADGSPNKLKINTQTSPTKSKTKSKSKSSRTKSSDSDYEYVNEEESFYEFEGQPISPVALPFDASSDGLNVSLGGNDIQQDAQSGLFEGDEFEDISNIEKTPKRAKKAKKSKKHSDNSEYSEIDPIDFTPLNSPKRDENNNEDSLPSNKLMKEWNNKDEEKIEETNAGKKKENTDSPISQTGEYDVSISYQEVPETPSPVKKGKKKSPKKSKASVINEQKQTEPEPEPKTNTVTDVENQDEKTPTKKGSKKKGKKTPKKKSDLASVKNDDANGDNAASKAATETLTDQNENEKEISTTTPKAKGKKGKKGKGKKTPKNSDAASVKSEAIETAAEIKNDEKPIETKTNEEGECDESTAPTKGKKGKGKKKGKKTPKKSDAVSVKSEATDHNEEEKNMEAEATIADDAASVSSPKKKGKGKKTPKKSTAPSEAAADDVASTTTAADAPQQEEADDATSVVSTISTTSTTKKGSAKKGKKGKKGKAAKKSDSVSVASTKQEETEESKAEEETQKVDDTASVTSTTKKKGKGKKGKKVKTTPSKASLKEEDKPAEKNKEEPATTVPKEPKEDDAKSVASSVAPEGKGSKKGKGKGKKKAKTSKASKDQVPESLVALKEEDIIPEVDKETESKEQETKDTEAKDGNLDDEVKVSPKKKAKKTKKSKATPKKDTKEADTNEEAPEHKTPAQVEETGKQEESLNKQVEDENTKESAKKKSGGKKKSPKKKPVPSSTQEAEEVELSKQPEAALEQKKPEEILPQQKHEEGLKQIDEEKEKQNADSTECELDEDTNNALTDSLSNAEEKQRNELRDSQFNYASRGDIPASSDNEQQHFVGQENSSGEGTLFNEEEDNNQNKSKHLIFRSPPEVDLQSRTSEFADGSNDYESNGFHNLREPSGFGRSESDIKGALSEPVWRKPPLSPSQHTIADEDAEIIAYPQRSSEFSGQADQLTLSQINQMPTKEFNPSINLQMPVIADEDSIGSFSQLSNDSSIYDLPFDREGNFIHETKTEPAKLVQNTQVKTNSPEHEPVSILKKTSTKDEGKPQKRISFAHNDENKNRSGFKMLPDYGRLSKFFSQWKAKLIELQREEDESIDRIIMGGAPKQTTETELMTETRPVIRNIQPTRSQTNQVQTMSDRINWLTEKHELRRRIELQRELNESLHSRYDQVEREYSSLTGLNATLASSSSRQYSTIATPASFKAGSRFIQDSQKSTRRDPPVNFGDKARISHYELMQMSFYARGK